MPIGGGGGGEENELNYDYVETTDGNGETRHTGTSKPNYREVSVKGTDIGNTFVLEGSRFIDGGEESTPVYPAGTLYRMDGLDSVPEANLPADPDAGDVVYVSIERPANFPILYGNGNDIYHNSGAMAFWPVVQFSDAGVGRVEFIEGLGWLFTVWSGPPSAIGGLG
ncbi:hypothetical protein [Haloarchaeobius sp. DT45]|uniref:hypothetical protein n=1 Tax=Haloarchaeobius sp. DT45 TaxID=3446116 RepID=UPI003F6B31EF